MHTKEFKEIILSPIKKQLKNFGEHNVWGAYDDVLYIYSLAVEIIKKYEGYNLFELLEEGKKDLANELHFRQNQIFTLLIAIHFFCSVFIDIFLSELVGGKIKFKGFIENLDSPFNNISFQEILPAYCIQIYRHKFIAHHDVDRIKSGTWKDLLGIKLRFHPLDFNISKTNEEKIFKLKEKYKSSISKLKEEENLPNLINILFYNVLIGIPGKISDDREEVNKIAEHVGCESMEFEEIINSIDRFSIAITKTLK